MLAWKKSKYNHKFYLMNKILVVEILNALGTFISTF